MFSNPSRTIGNLLRKHAGFTLIELLVVISIIALLAAILFPVFTRARESGRRASCQSNLRQIGLAYVQYSQDYDEFVPRYTYGGCCTPFTQYMWHDAIYEYIRSVQVFNCPSAAYGESDPGAPSKKFAKVTTVAVNPITGRTYLALSAPTTSTLPSYGANRNYFTRYSVGGVSTPFDTSADRKLIHFPVPAETVLVTDYMGSGTSSSSDIQGALKGTDAVYSKHIYRHLDTTNVLFADGHVKAMNKDRLIATHTVGAEQISYLFTLQAD